MPRRTILALTAGISIACGGGGVLASIHSAPRRSAFVSTNGIGNRLAVGRRGDLGQSSSIIEERRKATVDLDSVFSQPSVRCRRRGLDPLRSAAAASGRRQEEEELKSSSSIAQKPNRKVRSLI